MDMLLYRSSPDQCYAVCNNRLSTKNLTLFQSLFPKQKLNFYSLFPKRTASRILEICAGSLGVHHAWNDNALLLLHGKVFLIRLLSLQSPLCNLFHSNLDKSLFICNIITYI